MKKTVLELMEEFIRTATPESFLEDCVKFDIKLEDKDIEEYSSEKIIAYSKDGLFKSTNNQESYCLAA